MKFERFLESIKEDYPLAGELVDGLKVRSDVPNMSSISASLDKYKILKGIRKLKFSDFSGPDAKTSRIVNLIQQIEENGEINPLIVVVDSDGPYILEGAHRFDALQHMGKKEFPALVVIDED